MYQIRKGLSHHQKHKPNQNTAEYSSTQRMLMHCLTLCLDISTLFTMYLYQQCKCKHIEKGKTSEQCYANNLTSRILLLKGFKLSRGVQGHNLKTTCLGLRQLSNKSPVWFFFRTGNCLNRTALYSRLNTYEATLQISGIQPLFVAFVFPTFLLIHLVNYILLYNLMHNWLASAFICNS